MYRYGTKTSCSHMNSMQTHKLTVNCKMLITTQEKYYINKLNTWKCKDFCVKMNQREAEAWVWPPGGCHSLATTTAACPGCLALSDTTVTHNTTRTHTQEHARAIPTAVTQGNAGGKQSWHLLCAVLHGGKQSVWKQLLWCAFIRLSISIENRLNYWLKAINASICILLYLS